MALVTSCTPHVADPPEEPEPAEEAQQEPDPEPEPEQAAEPDPEPEPPSDPHARVTPRLHVEFENDPDPDMGCYGTPAEA